MPVTLENRATARAENRREGPLRALQLHTKTAMERRFGEERRGRLHAPGRARTEAQHDPDDDLPPVRYATSTHEKGRKHCTRRHLRRPQRAAPARGEAAEVGLERAELPILAAAERRHGGAHRLIVYHVDWCHPPL
jgi:hypothetical protein